MKSIWNRIRIPAISALVLIFLSILGLYIFRFEFRKPFLEIYFFNLNRGRSVFIITPKGKTILIDGGQNEEIIRELTKILPFYRRNIDTLIVTSANKKNSGGLVPLVERYNIGKIIEPEIMSTSTAIFAFEQAVKKKNLFIKKVKKGSVFEIDNVKFSVLFPDPYFKFNKTSLPDMVLKISQASSDMILLGDVSKTIQKSLISELSKSNIVEYAHSASDSRTSKELFDIANPDFVIINKKLSSRASSKPKKFDINSIDKNRVINLYEKGTVRFVFRSNRPSLK